CFARDLRCYIVNTYRPRFIVIEVSYEQSIGLVDHRIRIWKFRNTSSKPYYPHYKLYDINKAYRNSDFLCILRKKYRLPFHYFSRDLESNSCVTST
ncbi:hypothetical protein L9F63_013734, partial [Diploptera punctata]